METKNNPNEPTTTSEADRIKNIFLANISHEIRTPMNAISGFAHLLQKEELTDKQRHYVQSILDGSESLMELLSGILSMTNYENEAYTLHNETFNVLKLLKDVGMSMLPLGTEKKIQVLFDICPEVPGLISADKKKVRQIFINLMRNALEHMGEGTLLVSLKMDTSDITQTRLKLSLSVDHVKHKHAELMQMQGIFHGHLDGLSGSGLEFGLQVCKKYAELMQGSIAMSMGAGESPVVSFVFAYETVGPTQEPRSFPEGPCRELLLIQGQKRTFKVLIVDDELANRVLLEELMLSLGFQVHQASNGFEALEKVAQVKPDLVIMDIRMPKLDGLEVTRRLKNSEHRDIPVMIVSAAAFEEDQEAVKASGANGYMSKPIKGHQLLNEVCRLLGKNISR